MNKVDKLAEYFKEEGIFIHKCTCLWSKDDKYGFIPRTNCPVHGKQTRKMLKKTVNYKEKIK